uniref:Uncharacterized protein n=1 Tax=Ascaris lumbricoides TaxID=6252 RepID=A0A0M3HIR3_ASCLU
MSNVQLMQSRVSPGKRADKLSMPTSNVCSGRSPTVTKLSGMTIETFRRHSCI